MRLKAFRVQMFRPILDSTWVNVDDITVIVGKNESGKTALLQALHKFNPFSSEPYRLDREWPRGHRHGQSSDAVVVQTRFDFETAESDEIANIFPGKQKPTGVEISKTYEGEFTYKFLPNDPPGGEQANLNILSQLKGLCLGESASHELQEAVSQIRNEATQLVDTFNLLVLNDRIEDYKSRIDAVVQQTHEPDKKHASSVGRVLGEIPKLVNAAIMRSRVEDMVAEWLPTFIYMDDHKPFQGSAYLDQIKERKDSEQLTDQDRTFLMILDMADLDFEREFQRASEFDKEQRMLDMNDASLTLTKLLADHWSQRKYTVKFEADGYHMFAFVSDEIQTALVPLDERSKGFQWFFSFDTTFLYETQGTFQNAVILLDEPGLHLHADAQRDLLVRMKEYAKSNQLIYTTHMPFMINMERLDNIRVCIESKEKGSNVSDDLYAADEHARFPLQAAIGLAMSQSLFVGPRNLVVEGITDFWLISAMATIFRSENKPSLDERIVITPAGTATKAAYVATMLRGQKLNVAVLLDSDSEGKNAAEGLIKKWILRDRHVLLLGDVLERQEETTLEDLFPDEFYLNFVNEAYKRELNGTPIIPADVKKNKQSHPQLVKRIDAAFKKRSVKPNSDGWAFNKGRVAKLLLTDLSKRTSADLPDIVVKHFERLFGYINKAMPR